MKKLTPLIVLAPMALLGTATATFSFAVPALAQSYDSIVVSPGAMDVWRADTTRDLNRALLRQPTSAKFPLDNGVVQITFTLDAAGKAENLAIYRSSVDRRTENVAKPAIRRLNTLQDVPIANPAGAKFLANIIFADDERIKQHLTEKLAMAERVRLAKADPDSRYLSFGT